MTLNSCYQYRYLGKCRVRPAVAGASLKFPFIKQLFTQAGAIEANYHSLAATLKKGDSVALAPGGIAEIFMSSHKQEKILATHKVCY